jgi:hypothetical protein
MFQKTITHIQNIIHGNPKHNVARIFVADLHDLHEEWLVEKTKFQPLAAPVTVIDANDDLSVLADKYKSIKSEILNKR